MPHVHYMYDFMLEYYDLGLRFRDGVESMWETPDNADSFLGKCADFLKITEIHR